MRNRESNEEPPESRVLRRPGKELPRPTASFRRRAWLQFQRAIDPLAPPKPLRISRR